MCGQRTIAVASEQSRIHRNGWRNAESHCGITGIDLKARRVGGISLERKCKVRKHINLAALAAVMLLLAGFGMATASAENQCPHMFGSQQQLTDAGGAVVQHWTADGLQDSVDALPGYQTAGQLWEADVSVTAARGAVTPVIPSFQAVSHSGVRYPVLWQVPSTNGISGATLNEGQMSTGKLYFDVTADDPIALIYTTGAAQPAMMWCCAGSMMDMPMGSMGPRPNMEPGMQMGPGMNMGPGMQMCPGMSMADCPCHNRR